MVLTFASAVVVGLFVSGQVGLISFVALLNFTAGLWVAHSVHSLGNTNSEEEYKGVIHELREGGTGTETEVEAGASTGTESETTSNTAETDGFDTGRFGRLLGLIAAVTAVSLLTSAQVLPGAVLSIAVVALGSIALVTAIIGFFIALGASYDENQAQEQSNDQQTTSPINVESVLDKR